MRLEVSLVLILDLNARVGKIESDWAQTTNAIAAVTQMNVIIFCVVLVGSVAVALLISFFLARPLNDLAGGMVSMAELKFSSVIMYRRRTSALSEVSQCETWFDSLDRCEVMLKDFI